MKLPAKLDGLFKPCRYKVMYGGRGGGKSHGAASALLALGAQRPLRILCAREIQKSMRDSVHRLLKDKVAQLGLGHFYEITDFEIRDNRLRDTRRKRHAVRVFGPAVAYRGQHQIV